MTHPQTDIVKAVSSATFTGINRLPKTVHSVSPAKLKRWGPMANLQAQGAGTQSANSGHWGPKANLQASGADCRVEAGGGGEAACLQQKYALAAQVGAPTRRRVNNGGCFRA